MEKLQFDTKQPLFVPGILGDTYVYVNEQEIEVEEYPNIMEGDDSSSESTTVTKYLYDVIQVPNKCQTEDQILAVIKEMKIAELTCFDKGEYAQYGNQAINDFTIGGIHMWLDKTTRNGLDYRFKCEKSTGLTETTLWYGTTPITLDIDAATLMLAQVEVYASKCFDKTAAHHQAINSLQTIEEVVNYDYKADYPSKVVFG